MPAEEEQVEEQITAGIRDRLAALRNQQAALEREAQQHQQAAQQAALAALRLAGGIDELKALLSGFDPPATAVAEPDTVASPVVNGV